MEIESRLYEKLPDGSVKCLTCPHYCVIKEGHTGICGLRVNRNGKLYFTAYGMICTEAIDPIFKKPLFNFYPGADIYSVSSISCNFKCPWCQNYSISQFPYANDVPTYYVSPEELIARVKKYNVRHLAFTYAEPAVWFEYVHDVFKLAHEEGILNTLVTNGYWSKESIEKLRGLVDAANVDIKAFKDEVYTKYIKGRINPVLEAVRRMFNQGVHIELTMLIVPTVNDNLEDVRSFCKWVVNELSPDVPVHFSRFYPHYKFLNVPPTPVDFLVKCREIANEEGLRYVYLGNVPGSYEDTICPNCGTKVVGRWGFELTDWNLDNENRCKKCGYKIAIVGKPERGSRRHLFYL